MLCERNILGADFCFGLTSVPAVNLLKKNQRVQCTRASFLTMYYFFDVSSPTDFNMGTPSWRATEAGSCFTIFHYNSASLSNRASKSGPTSARSSLISADFYFVFMLIDYVVILH
jgi:hypothetical protein